MGSRRASAASQGHSAQFPDNGEHPIQGTEHISEEAADGKNTCLLFPIVEFICRDVALPKIYPRQNTPTYQRFCEIITGIVDSIPVLIVRLHCDTTGNYDSLGRCNSWRNNQALVVNFLCPQRHAIQLC